MSSNKPGFGSKLDTSAVKTILEFLFGRPASSKKGSKKDDSNTDDSKYLDMRTDIGNKEIYQALVYYRILQEQFNSPAAGAVGDMLERLAIGTNRGGRLEAVAILKQQLPKEEVLLKGIAESLKTEE